MNTQFDFNEFVYDGREISEETVNWKDIKVGDVVIQGFSLNNKLCEYITLTFVEGKYWEYFENGYYKSTSPEFCHWVVRGQTPSNGKLKRIIYE